MAEDLSKNFETLQLHAGTAPRSQSIELLTDVPSAGHSPDPATKSRAVPIYATTVRRNWIETMYEHES
jgi:hypothetical protein